MNNAKFTKAQQDLADTYEVEQRNYIQNKIETIAHSAANKQSSIAWQTINEISSRKSTNKSKLKASSQQERLNKWKDHLQNLLGKSPAVSDKPVETIINYILDIKVGDFTEDELVDVMNVIKNRKAAGLNNIPPEVWKTEAFNDILLELCNAVHNQNPIEKWTEGCILPFPKKGDLGITKNYRGITLTAIASKIYNKMLLNRI